MWAGGRSRPGDGRRWRYQCRHRERVRLQGIDAPELHQTCTAYGQEWPCGRTAAEWLKNRLHGRQVECVGHARDRHGRLLAVC
jgi:endonuclease YncB( thermonuclease family)